MSQAIPTVKTHVTLERLADGVSRVKFRVRYDTDEGSVDEDGTTLRKARERAAQILARNPHAAYHTIC